MTFHKRGRRAAFIAIFAASVCFASAQNTAAFRGIVHDPQHRPIPHARVTIQGRSLTSNSEGEFKADKLNPGQYTVTISAPGFSPLQEQIHLTPSRNPIFHFQLQLGAITASVKVAASASTLNTEASTVRTNVSHAEILRTPGAGRTNSLAMIT
ncbi:MAG: carboxypeptidase regulatory-like domain-containing protein, partial [Bryobacteraceae bacterium]